MAAKRSRIDAEPSVEPSVQPSVEQAVEQAVIELQMNQLKSFLDIRVVHDPPLLGIHLAGDVHLDDEVVAVDTLALVPLGGIG